MFNQHSTRKSFKKAEGKSRLITRVMLHGFYSLYDQQLETLLLVKEILIKENKSESKYSLNKARLILLSKYLQHTESAVLLGEAGLYGDMVVCLRGILYDLKMLEYLQYKPDLVEKFLKEKEEDYYDRSTGFKAVFSERVIDKELKERGVYKSSESVAYLSKAAHASALGTQFYGTDSGKNDNVYHLKYKPGFESLKAHAFFSIIAPALYDFGITILNWRTRSNIETNGEDWKKVSGSLEKVEPKLTKFLLKNRSYLQYLKEKS